MITPLQLLYEEIEPTGAPPAGARGTPPAGASDLPPDLAKLYGGPLRLDRPEVYANFVASIDGAVALPAVAESNALISGGSAADRFVMGLLRARADVVLIGSGTLQADPRSSWSAEEICPPAASAYAGFRTELGLPPRPRVAVVSRSGRLDTAHPVFGSGAAVVLTSGVGAERLAGQLPEEAEVLAVGDDDRLDPVQAIDALRQRGHRHILSEAGPHLFGSMLAAGVVDELFLTRSPMLAGHSGNVEAWHLVEGTGFLPDHPIDARLVSVRMHGAYLFLRYAI